MPPSSHKQPTRRIPRNSVDYGWIQMKRCALLRPMHSWAEMMDKLPFGGSQFPRPKGYRPGHEVHFERDPSLSKLSRHCLEEMHTIGSWHIGDANEFID